jgi:serine protease Do
LQKAKVDYESVLRIPLSFGDSEAGHDIARERLPQLATLAPTPEASPPSGQVLPTPEALFLVAKRFVYIVLTKEADSKISQGSAVAVSPTTFFTACHVLDKSVAAILISHDGRRIPATLRGSSPARDRCELVTTSPVTEFAPIRSVPTLAVGERVYAIGAPKALDVGMELSFTDGVVSSMRKENGDPVIQTSAPISSGSSGGGLFNAKGQLVGITVSTHKSAQNMNFAIPVDLYRF